jgi:hypothetical protein
MVCPVGRCLEPAGCGREHFSGPTTAACRSFLATWALIGTRINWPALCHRVLLATWLPVQVIKYIRATLAILSLCDLLWCEHSGLFDSS